MFFCKKKKIELPIEFGNFPPYTGKIKKGPVKIDKPKYTRYEYYVQGGIEEYKQQLFAHGFRQKTEVRFDRGTDDYIIIEKQFINYKIVYHKKK